MKQNRAILCDQPLVLISPSFTKFKLIISGL